MINKIKNYLKQLSNKELLDKVKYDLEQIKINNGRLFGEINLLHKSNAIKNNIHQAEFQVFSQWGDDGIINFLVNTLDIDNKKFIEFGVENYTECNTRFLLMNNNWSGLIIDGSEDNVKSVQNENIYWKHDLIALAKFVTAENINQIFSDHGFTEEIGLLHIDIDGNDYWLWKEIKVINPVIVIVEYNSIFGSDKPWTIPYQANFFRTNAHYSNLYYGTSLLSLCDLAEIKGYDFIGCNSSGNNAYFIRKDKNKGFKSLTAKEGYVESKFKEARNHANQFIYTSGAERLKLLKNMEVYNTRTSLIEKIM